MNMHSQTCHLSQCLDILWGYSLQPLSSLPYTNAMRWIANIFVNFSLYIILWTLVASNGSPIQIITSLKEEFIAHVSGNTISWYGVTYKMKERTTAPRSLSPPISQVHVGFSPTSRKHLGQQCSFTFSKMKVSSSPIDMLNEKDYSRWPYLGHNMSSELLCLLVRSMWYVDRRPPGGWEPRQSGFSGYMTRRKKKILWEHSPLESLKIWKPLCYINVLWNEMLFISPLWLTFCPLYKNLESGRK